MLDEQNTADLLRSLNSFKVPMFAVEIGEDTVCRAGGHNRAFENFTGLVCDRVVGQELHRFMRPEDADFACQNHLDCAHSRQTKDVSSVIDHPAGRLLCSSTLVPMVNTSGRVYRIIGTNRGVNLDQSGPPIEVLMRDLTDLTSDLEITLGRALMQVEFRQQQSDDLSQEDHAFLDRFRRISAAALTVSMRISDAVDEAGRETVAMKTLLEDDGLADKVVEFATLRRAD